ncbi:cupin domain-containing protein [Georgenia sp. TF02-10]|uniref:cupin domain-containing protein n=1 Tax=Georgenia sp. TF02-10 TaxID=2917725 RepID=UPI001FA7F3CA|nr:cupin domain-containing protein [Georgenia sp. TF02-10]UNX55866.1 cupin domain-containing protein [Georgenia sp. TF02-10]
MPVHLWSREAEPERSHEFRRVLWTGEHSQLVVMTIPPGDEIGEETHPDNDQIRSFVSGAGKAVVDGEEQFVAPGDIVAVPAGARHNVVNVGPGPLVLYAICSPPRHAEGTVHGTREEAATAAALGDDAS